MKRKIVLLIIVFYPLIIFSQNWDYPIKPGTKDWNTLKTHDEKVLLCQIPNNILKQSSTVNLLELCLNYPLSFDFYAYNSLKEGICKVLINFNGFKELFSRKDNFSVLKEYITLKSIQDTIGSKANFNDKGEMVYRYSIIECLLSFDSFINNATANELISIKKEMGIILEYKLKHKELFSDYSNAASALLLGKSLKKINSSIKFTNETELFLESGELKSEDVLRELTK